MNEWKRNLLTLSVLTSLSFTTEARTSVSSSSTAFVPHKLSTSSKSRTMKITTTSHPCPTCEPTKSVLGTSSSPIDKERRRDSVSSSVSLLPELSSFDDSFSQTKASPSKLESSLLFRHQVSRPTIKDVTVSLLPEDNKVGDEPAFKKLPLVVTPRDGKSSLKFLTSFLQGNKDWIGQQMLHYGAVLFRGFDVQDAADVETAIQSYQPKLNNQYRGTSPRDVQPGTEYVFSAAEVPSHYPIAQHLEMSFLPAPPKQLFFSAIKAPTTVGGETALADFRKVYQDIPKALRNKLTEKKIKYTRTHHRVGAKGFITRDVASLQGWPDVFGTDDKAEVEAIAKSEDMPMRWEGRNNDDGDTFVSETLSEPFQLHPVTREPVWFNHAQVFHWTTFPAELLFAFQRTRQWKLLVQAVIVGIFSIIKYGILRHKMALHPSFGDGTPISIREMSQIRHAVHKNMVFNRWQKGDILMIDNFSTSHGRQPTYDKGRKVVVAWSDPLVKANDYFDPSGKVTTKDDDDTSSASSFDSVWE